MSQNFLENAILLLLTASLSGFLVPSVLKQIDERKLKAQKQFDVSLARENNVLEAQIMLLENLSKALWELQLLSLSVSYYKVHSNEERFKEAFKEYDDKSWVIFKDVRCEVSKAKRLASKGQYQNLLDFFDINLIQRDEQLMLMIKNNASLEEWGELYKWLLFDFPKKIDLVITPLAEDLRLSSLNK